MEPKPFLQIKNVRVVYPNGTVALRSVSFDAQEGEIIAIIGKSGAGKSTLLRCINGLQSFQDGSIVFHQKNISTIPNVQLHELRKKIGFIWQEHNLVERLSALRNVLTGRLAYNPFFKSLLGLFTDENLEIALHNLERVHLLHRAYHRADQLSGGEKQRISIARALTQQPTLLLADEPVCCLDPEMAWKVIRDLERLAREDNVLTLINIHHVEFAKVIADRIIGIARGEVVFDGTPMELTESVMDEIYGKDGYRPESNIVIQDNHEEPAVAFG